MKRLFFGLALFVIAINHAVCADNLHPIRAILQLPEDKIDLAKAKLIIDKMIDPGIDIEANLKNIHSITANIQSTLPAHASDGEKLQALRTYIYTSGNWNAHQPFSYDLADPLGQKISNKLLPTYLATRKGNCVSMPILFVVVGQRLGLNLTLAVAPAHFYVIYRDPLGAQINLETTSGANPARDVWIRQQNPMTDEAIANGIYMRALSKKEVVANMSLTLAEYYSRQHQYEQVMRISDLVLEYSPKSVEAMLHKGHASAQLIKEQFISKYPRPYMIPPEKVAYFHYLDQTNRDSYANAEALGWREPTQEQETKYLQRTKQATLH